MLSYLERLADRHLSGAHRIQYKHVMSPNIEKTEEDEEAPPLGTPERARWDSMCEDARHLIGGLSWSGLEHVKLQVVAMRLAVWMKAPTPTRYAMAKQALSHELAFPLPKRRGRPNIYSLQLSAHPIIPLSPDGAVEPGLYGIFDGSPSAEKPVICEDVST